MLLANVELKTQYAIFRRNCETNRKIMQDNNQEIQQKSCLYLISNVVIIISDKILFNFIYSSISNII